ncbi:MAG: HAMP domain-containing histidine kinase [Bacteroidetes bacterium]|nr:HAMP domain-containing histidine kinase [Bacteroidota bacterium]
MSSLLGLIALEYFFASNLIIHYTSIETQALDVAYGYLAALIVCYMLLHYFKKRNLIINEELKKLNDSKVLFFNIIAHDLRSPFNGILGFTSLMSDKSNNLTIEEFKKYAELTKKSAEKTFELLESLLEWGRIQMNKIQYNPQPIKLNQIIDDILNLYEEKFKAKDIELSVQISNEIYVLADLYVLQTIIRNFISNAIKFTPNGGEIRISTEEYNTKNILIIVKDNGVGMDSKIIENLFYPDINTNRAGLEGEKSNGLGSIICKELIEKQGGHLLIESEVNQGSMFKFTVVKSKMPLPGVE